ncbi:fimbria/pilus outer membrane usher protein [Enterobacter hormaechei]|uniref:fimbria/pilus outer membrane usher protein n=1 Tax=Enterobacter hormaechei TaxID=158836 RepID=UPI0032DB36E8
MPERGWPLSWCAAGVMLALMAPGSARAGDVATAAVPDTKGTPGGATTSDDRALSFESDFLAMPGSGVGKHVDLSYFAHRGGMMPGTYQVQVSVNGKVVEDAKTLTFRSWPDSPGKLYACVDAGMLADWGVKVSGKVKGGAYPAGAGKPDGGAGSVASDAAHAPAGECPVGGVATLVPWSTEKFDFNRKRLQLTVPQESLGAASMMRTSPSRWDEGIPALLINYNYNGNRQGSTGEGNGSGQSGSDFLGLNGQLNLLGWRVRSGANWQSTRNGDQQWTTQDVYAQHDYSVLRGGQFSAGRLTSDGSVVDSVPFVGMKMESDEGMLNPEFSSYRPAITGIANTPATVIVRQYGKIIYQQNVPQGPFSLTDFNRSGNGDVDVEIRESDGSVRRFTMAAVVTPALMSKGALGYSFSAGKFRDGRGYLPPEFVQGNLSFGLGANTSLLAGTLLSGNYQTVSAGGGVYSPLLGVFSLTGAMSSVKLSRPAFSGDAGRQYGVSGQFSWSRNIGEVAVGFAATRYASRNFRTFSDVQQMTPEDVGKNNGQRATYQVTLSRSLGAFGSLSLSGNQTEYWQGQPTRRGYTLGYNTTVKGIGIGVSAGYNTYVNDGSGGSSWRGDSGRTDRNIAVNISLPLGRWLGGGSMNGNYMYSRYNGRVNQQAGVSGSVLDNRGSWSVSQGWGDSDSRNASVGYGARYASFSGGYSTYGDNHSWTYGMSGAVLVHPGGVTMARQLSLDSGTALIEMPGIGGVKVNGVETDWRGYAVVSGLTPYDLNRMNADMSTLPGNVELDSSSKNTVPSRGSVVRVKFSGSQGYRVLFALARAAGGNIPFGAVVSLKKEGEAAGQPHTGIVDDDGQAYVSGLPEKGSLDVIWSDGQDGRCTADYHLPPGADEKTLTRVTATCR